MTHENAHDENVSRDHSDKQADIIPLAMVQVASEPRICRKLELLENRFTMPPSNSPTETSQGNTSIFRHSPPAFPIFHRASIDSNSASVDIQTSSHFDVPSRSYQSISQASEASYQSNRSAIGDKNINNSSGMQGTDRSMEGEGCPAQTISNTNLAPAFAANGIGRDSYPHSQNFDIFKDAQDSNQTLLTTHTTNRNHTAVVKEAPPNASVCHSQSEQLIAHVNVLSEESRTQLYNVSNTKRKSVPVKRQLPSVKENANREMYRNGYVETATTNQLNLPAVVSSNIDSKRKRLDFDPPQKRAMTAQCYDYGLSITTCDSESISNAATSNDTKISPNAAQMKSKVNRARNERNKENLITSPVLGICGEDNQTKSAKCANKGKNTTSSNNSSLPDFFPVVTKRHTSARSDGKLIIQRQENNSLPLPRKPCTLDKSQDQDQSRVASTDMVKQLQFQLTQVEHWKARCVQLEQTCQDKDEQLKAIANNRTILHAALKSTVQQLEGEILSLQKEKETREIATKVALEKLIRQEAEQQGRQLRDNLAKDGTRLGRIVYTRAGGMMGRSSHVENWEEGHAQIELRLRQAQLDSKRLTLESRLENALLELKRLREGETSSTDGVLDARDQNEMASSLNLDAPTLIDALEAVESIRTHLSFIVQQEQDLAIEEQKLKDEKGAHIRALKLVASEDSSRFRSRPKLHDRYVLQALLGKGGFSEVWRAYDLVELREVAVKIHQLDPRWPEAKKENYTKHVSREYEIHRSVRHPRIVSLYDVFEIDNNSFATVLECCKGTDLDTLLKARRRLPEREARSILLQIIAGMKYLSHPSSDHCRQGIIHYDLKPGNILFDEFGDAKITDFGLSKIVDTPDPADSMELTSQGAGTYWYLPPECFVVTESVRISNKVDVWSIGVIFYQMLFGKRPFGDDLSQEKIMSSHTMLNAQEVQFPSSPEITTECKEFIRLCLTFDQVDRPNVAQLCENGYILKET